MNAPVSTFRHRLRTLALCAGAVAAWSLQSAARADELVVSAAASLTNAFRAVATAFEKTHPNTNVVLNFGASDALLQQILNGAPADVFASADEIAMDKAVEAKAVAPATRHDFATNSLVMIVPSDSKLKVPSVRDAIGLPQVKRIALGDPASVPVGRYTKAALEHEGTWNAVNAKAVLANNVRQALDYVARGEVEAGFVYSTDAALMPEKVKIAAVVPTEKPVAYPLALVKRSTHAADAEAFARFVLSPAGQAILTRYGFKPPASH
jgi:molybdate transport system substrate-binding protein